MHQDLPSVLLDWSRVDVEAPTPGGDLIVDKTCRTARQQGTRGIHRVTSWESCLLPNGAEDLVFNRKQFCWPLQ